MFWFVRVSMGWVGCILLCGRDFMSGYISRPLLILFIDISRQVCHLNIDEAILGLRDRILLLEWVLQTQFRFHRQKSAGCLVLWLDWGAELWNLQLFWAKHRAIRIVTQIRIYVGSLALFWINLVHKLGDLFLHSCISWLVRLIAIRGRWEEWVSLSVDVACEKFVKLNLHTALILEHSFVNWRWQNIRIHLLFGNLQACIIWHLWLLIKGAFPGRAQVFTGRRLHCQLINLKLGHGIEIINCLIWELVEAICPRHDTLAKLKVLGRHDHQWLIWNAESRILMILHFYLTAFVFQCFNWNTDILHFAWSRHVSVGCSSFLRHQSSLATQALDLAWQGPSLVQLWGEQFAPFEAFNTLCIHAESVKN